jgi:parallel beta helix pectate lyase-like protein
MPSPGILGTWRRAVAVTLTVLLVAFVSGGALALVLHAPGAGAPPAGRPSAPATVPPSSSGSSGARRSIAPSEPIPPEQTAFYIAPNGSDANRGTLDSPWLTFTHAASLLRPGDTLFARGGRYPGQTGAWVASGTATDPIVFRSYPGEQAVFDGVDRERQFVFFQGAVAFVTFADLTITGYHPVDSGIVEIIESANHLTLDGLTMTGNSGPTENEHLIYIAASDVHDITIRNSRLDGIGGGAIHLFHPPNARHVTIDHNVISGCHWGVIATSGADDVRIEHNTFVANEIAVELSDATNVRIVDNLSDSPLTGRRLGVGLWVDSLTSARGLVEDYNLWFRAGGDPIRGDGQPLDLPAWRALSGMSAHSLDLDPRLLPDGAPAPDSPAVGAASDGGTIGAG